MDKITAILTMVIVAAIGTTGMILLKLGTNNLNKKNYSNQFINKILQLILNKFILLGIFCYFLSSLLFTWILQTNKLSFIYPLNAISTILIVLFSVKIFNEKMNKYKWAGLTLVIAGIIILAL